MFQWIAEVAASPPYQLMADGDQASRIAVEKGVAEHQTIDVLCSCQVKNFFSAPNYYLCIFVQESCSKKVCPYRCL